MKRISLQRVPTEKRHIIPIAIFAVCAAIFSAVVLYIFGGSAGEIKVFILYIIAIPLVIGITIRLLAGRSEYMDEVYDCGDSLLLKYDGKKEKIRIEDIEKVIEFPLLDEISYPTAMLVLRKECAFGKRIYFYPSSYDFRLKNPSIEALKEKVRDSAQ